MSLFPTDIEPDFGSISVVDIEPQTQALYRFLGSTAKNTECSVNQYRSNKCGRSYWRVSWRDGRKMKHLHIPGGSTQSELANYRARKISAIIERGAELAEVIAAVKTYRS